MRRRSQRGNTLIELLTATVIIGVISFALTESLISGLENTGDTQQRLTGSIDRQRLASAFVPDVQSAQRLETAAPPCGEIPDDVIGNLLWSDGEVNYQASYVVVDSKLLRRLCADEGPSDENGEVLAEVSDEIAPEITLNPPTNDRMTLRVCGRAASTTTTAPNSDCFDVVATRKVLP